MSYLISAPSLLLIALMVVFPILYTFFISLTNMSVYHWFDFTVIGLQNYWRALFVFDSGFLSALLATVLWTAVNMVLQLVLAFLLASALNVPKLRPRKIYKTLLMFPWAMPGYVSILLWKTGIFNSEFGLLNQLTFVGMPTVFYGDELGMTGLKELDYRAPMAWDGGSQELAEFFRRLAALRTRFPALRRGNFRVLCAQGGLLVYQRQLEESTITVALNAGDAPAALPELPGACLWAEGLTGKCLDGWGFSVFHG